MMLSFLSILAIAADAQGPSATILQPGPDFIKTRSRLKPNFRNFSNCSKTCKHVAAILQVLEQFETFQCLIKSGPGHQQV